MGAVGEKKNVQLLKPHRHKGTLHPAGFFLALDPRVADWLIEQGRAIESRAALLRPRIPQKVVRRGCCGGR